MRIFKKLFAAAVLMAAFTLTAAAGEIGTGPVVTDPPATPTTSATSGETQPADEPTSEGGEIGTGPAAAITLLVSLFSALP